MKRSRLNLGLPAAVLAAALATEMLGAVAAPSHLAAEPRFSDIMPPAETAAQLVSTMTDTELLGQIFLLGYAGSLPSPAILSWIHDHGLGAVKIFGWNGGSLDDLTASISQMQHAAQATRLGIPLIIATDQEGGWVRHVHAETSATPGNMAIGASNLPSDAYQTGYYIGTELKALGVNMNFAPTVDVLSNPRADVIGPRSFGSDPVQTSLLSVAFFRGLQKVGVISTAKHYPGHGDTSVDSHGALPIIDASFDQIWERDLVPYRFLAREGIPAIMVGHLAYPAVTGNRLPATLSPDFERDILRGRIGFRGVIVTDDLLMAGVQDTGLPLPQIAEDALEAGDDMLMISQTPALDAPVWADLLARMKSDPAFHGVVERAAERVLALKATYLRGPNAVPLFPSAAAAKKQLPDKTGRDFFFEQACRAVTLVRPGGIPLGSLAGKRILIAGQYPEFLAAGKARYPDADTLLFAYDPPEGAPPAEIERVKNAASGHDVVIFGLANPNSMDVLQALRGIHAEVDVMSALSPAYLRNEPWVSSAIAVYGTAAASFEAGFAVLSGDFPAEGRLPIDSLAGVF